MRATPDQVRRAPVLVVVFAKAPQAGRVKTRLARTVGAAGAAHIHRQLVERTLATALESGCGDVELHGSPASHSVLRAIARRNGVALRSQTGGDIGQRMAHAFRTGLRMYRRVVLVGSDCPPLTASDVRDASRLLQGCDAVLAPAEDGGYPLIGLSRGSPRIFEGIAWSTPSVMQQTRQALAALGWRWRELRTLWDVDRPEDLPRLRASGFVHRR